MSNPEEALLSSLESDIDAVEKALAELDEISNASLLIDDVQPRIQAIMDRFDSRVQVSPASGSNQTNATNPAGVTNQTSEANSPLNLPG